MMVREHADGQACNQEAGCLYAIINGRRPVSRRNRASWYLNQLNKVVKCEPSADGGESRDSDEEDISLVSITKSTNKPYQFEFGGREPKIQQQQQQQQQQQNQFLVTPNTRVLFLSKSIATSIVLDLSPSVVSVSSQNGCVFIDSMFDALKRVLHLLVKTHEIPSSTAEQQQQTNNKKPLLLEPKVFVTVIGYTPFTVAKNNQVLVQNRRISSSNIDQVLVEIWICLNRLTQEIYELVSSTCGISLDFDVARGDVFVFPHPVSSGILRQPATVLEDIYQLGLFSSSLMPKQSRLSVIIITDGLLSSTNDLNDFRLRSIAVAFVSLGSEVAYPDACFGYTPYIDLMKFIAKTTLGVHLSHQDLINSSSSMSKSKQVPLMSNPLYKLFCSTLHSELSDEQLCCTPKISNFLETTDPITSDLIEVSAEHVARFFCVDQPIDALQPAMGLSSNGFNGPSIQSYHDWRSFRQLDRNLDADFEQVLACLLREGYLIKSIQFKHKESSRIVARLVLHSRHNLDLEQELTAPYWSNTDPFDIGDNNHLIMRPLNTPLYGDTYCEIFVHGSYSFLHNMYSDRRAKRKSEYRDVAHRQFKQLIDGVLHTFDRLQYLSRFYRDSSLSKVPSFLLHGNSLLYEQPHTHRLTSTIENVTDESKTSEFQEYWQKISCLDMKTWKNLMHMHTIRLVLEHDQPKHKNIHCQNANGRYTHVQCRRALSAISTFIKSYSSFALLEDTTYIKFIYNKDDDLREIETSATKGFIVIQINKLLPIIVIYLMFTSGILDSHRIQIVSYLENQLVNCKLRNVRAPSTVQMDNILKSKTVSPSSESCCVAIRSPLERMLKLYSRNFIGELLVHNWSHGLPGSCPYNTQSQSLKVAQQQTGAPNNTDAINNPVLQQQQQQQTRPRGTDQGTNVEGYTSGRLTNRYNLVFSKYLYGVRVINTIKNLPHDIVPSLAANVLAKISAILVNVRIKQGFHIAFNNSGILNLVVELSMKDHSNQEHASSCLCQYIVFPPTVTNCTQAPHTVLQNNISGTSTSTSGGGGGGVGGVSGVSSGGVSSKPGSLSGSLVNSDSYMKNAQDCSSNTHIRERDNGEIKIIKEYWIEQQYGISSYSEDYHQCLQDMRYSEVVDHLFITDSSIFDCLLTYDLLQLLCDKQSLYYELDSSFAKAESKTQAPIFSPTTSTTSSNIIDSNYSPSTPTLLPSTLIEGNTKDGNSKVPLIDLEYTFSLTKFFDYCQQASLNVLLFKDRTEFYEPDLEELEKMELNCKKRAATATHMSQISAKIQQARKMSVDVNDLEEHAKREHRASYQLDNLNSMGAYPYVNPIYSPSLNHLFLETLHKRLKQMHDKELKLTEDDLARLPMYLKHRRALSDEGQSSDIEDSVFYTTRTRSPAEEGLVDLEEHPHTTTTATSAAPSNKRRHSPDYGDPIEWRCFLRKGNQDNLMIVLIPATLDDVSKWLDYINGTQHSEVSFNAAAYKDDSRRQPKYDPVCPIFVFRCSSTMVNDHILSFLREDSSESSKSCVLESDLSLHFGQPCTYLGQLMAYNDELNNEILPLTRFGILNQATSDEKTLEVVHFRAFLRKIKNTVLKSRFSSLNDAYLSELFIHKDDILYYINNVDMDTQKKYHVSSQLKSLSDFIKSYEEYYDSLPKEPGKPCNQLLNSILLQKCGLFINQPIARFNEANPLIKQLHDKKLLFLMRCNYKVELPILEENLAGSKWLKNFIKPSIVIGGSGGHMGVINPAAAASAATSHISSFGGLSSSIGETGGSIIGGSSASVGGVSTCSLGKGSGELGLRHIEMKYGSVGTTTGSPSAVFAATAAATTTTTSTTITTNNNSKLPQTPRFGSSSLNNHHQQLPNPANETIILEAFRGSKCCLLKEVPMSPDDCADICLRHEAHMAEVLRRSGERKESHHYRRVLKSKGNYNQSHSAIDQALKRVDSLGRLEHFCLTPLLFSPSWRSKLAPVRDHTLESTQQQRPTRGGDSSYYQRRGSEPSANRLESSGDTTPGSSISGTDTTATNQQQQEADDRWHQLVCNNYIKEYEQYIQTLGFNSVQIRYQSSAKNSIAEAQLSAANTSSSNGPNGGGSKPPSARKSSRTHSNQSTTTTNYVNGAQNSSYASPKSSSNGQNLLSNQSSSGNASIQLRKGSISTSTGSLLASSAAASTTTTSATYNTGYLIKFLNSGCLVFKVGFCKPYVYSILYSIEGERFNNSNMKVNMTTFLDELDNIKVTMHLHSFTYDYHLRSMYSYISGRQLTFSPGYHLISFLDEFRKYYQKAPNYARNHILCGEVCVTNIKVTGQQLYNYIVTHNSAYNMEVLEMSSSMSNILSSLSSRTFIVDQKQQDSATAAERGGGAGNGGNGAKDASGGAPQSEPATRSHANDYVLIELKREKVRYRDGKDPDIFDCGLLITHDIQNTNPNKNSLTLKYFLLLTNQRDLYPKLIHTYDNIISFGCHRPIRLGLAQLKARSQQTTTTTTTMTIHKAPPSSVGGQSDVDDIQSSELQSSGEMSGPQSIISTANSVQSSNSGLQFGALTAAGQLDSIQQQQQPLPQIPGTVGVAGVYPIQQQLSNVPKITIEQSEEAADVLKKSSSSSGAADLIPPEGRLPSTVGEPSSNPALPPLASSVEDSSFLGENSHSVRRRERNNSTNSASSKQNGGGGNGGAQERTICDEEITYLGYFSSDEMDMLRFLQEKTTNLRKHIEHVVRLAEVHYRRDYLWHKLMQRTTTAVNATKSEEIPLTIEELIQLLTIVEAVDLAALDPQLSVFTTMHINWYMKLLKAFGDLRQSSMNQHRIYVVKASRLLLLYIDPKCTTAFILLTIDTERSSVELNLLFKDKQECSGKSVAGEKASIKSSGPAATSDQSLLSHTTTTTMTTTTTIELDQDCQQLINDFINFCATFMWSTFLV